MGRKRYIHTDISTDPKVAELAEHGALPLLLYTWAIPHMDDWGRMIGEARQFKLLVCPALDVTAAQVDEALDQIADAELWQRYEVKGRVYLQAPQDAWFKHQSYIGKDKRTSDTKSAFPSPSEECEHRETPNFAEERRETPQNTASPSPSPSGIKNKPAHASARGAVAEALGAITWGNHSLNEQVFAYLDDGEMEPEAVMLAIQQCMDNGAKFGYLRRILEDWHKQGVRTESDAQAAIAAHKSKFTNVRQLPRGQPEAAATYEPIDAEDALRMMRGEVDSDGDKRPPP